MDAEDLRTTIQGNGGVTVSFIQQNRLDIERVTGKTPPKRPLEIGEWWDNNKSVVSRRLNEKLENNQSEESEEDNQDSNEGN